mmetsp:Transcript_8486/g.11693  ORF Transcript_8486/g.11693 Transcript_8486/m.11693 type:complete len:286 (+) Transcript_8486:1316-2173(+)
MRLDDVSQIDNVSLSQPADRYLGHLYCVVELILCQLDFEFLLLLDGSALQLRLAVVLVVAIDFLQSRVGVVRSSLCDLGHIATDEIIRPVVSLPFNILIGDHVRRVHFRNQVLSVAILSLLAVLDAISQIVDAIKSPRLHSAATYGALGPLCRLLAITLDRQQLRLTFLRLALETLIQELLCLDNSRVECRQQVLGTLKHVFVKFARVVPGHALVPNVDHDENVFYAHSLQQGEQLLTAALLVAIVVTFSNVGGLFIVIDVAVVLLVRILAACRHAISHDATFSL